MEYIKEVNLQYADFVLWYGIDDIVVLFGSLTITTRMRNWTLCKINQRRNFDYSILNLNAAGSLIALALHKHLKRDIFTKKNGIQI